MVQIYPWETSADVIWSVERQLADAQPQGEHSDAMK